MPNPESTSPIGVLIAQLGTPDVPTTPALRRYLRQFLSDMRVIDLNPLKWQLILNLFVLNRRPSRVAALYKRIWTDEGSPLMLHSRRQVEGLQARLGSRYRVILGMRYGNPSIGEAMRTLESEGIDRVLVFSMFPQFSCTTTASIYDAVYLAAAGRTSPLAHDRKRSIPALRFVPPYYADQGYIRALAVTIDQAVAGMGRTPDRYVFTYHGVPQRYVDEGDPYRGQCAITSSLLADALGLAQDRWLMTFQSRFGSEVWLQPYTDVTLERLGAEQTGALLAACPGFTADCLETIDEIGREGAQSFKAHGGGEFALAPCLNAHPVWLDAMTDIVRRETMGWVDGDDDTFAVPRADRYSADRVDRTATAAGE